MSLKNYVGLFLIGVTSAACGPTSDQPLALEEGADPSARPPSALLQELRTGGRPQGLRPGVGPLDLRPGARPYGLRIGTHPPALPASADLAAEETTLEASGAQLRLLAGQLGGQGNVDGKGAAARFDTPGGVVADGAGNLYIADSNSGIRKVVIATRQVSTLALSDPDALYAPSGIVLDGAGNLYVSKRWDHTISKVVIATGQVTTLAGSAGLDGNDDGIGAAARFREPMGLALDGHGNLDIADSLNHTIRQLKLATGEVTTLAGDGAPGRTDGWGWSAQFNTPTGLAADGRGHLYVADSLNSSIRKIVIATGHVTTEAGTTGVAGSNDGIGAAARFDQPIGVTLDGAGNLYVGDSQTLRKVELATRKVTTLAGAAYTEGSDDGIGAAARFVWPAALAGDGRGHLYVADKFAYTIRKVELATRQVTTLVGSAGGAKSVDGTGAAARFVYPMSVALGRAGHLYVADWIDNVIRQVNSATGEVTTLAGTPGAKLANVDGTGAAARFGELVGMALDNRGNLYVADQRFNTIRKLELATRQVTTLAGTPNRNGGSKDGIGAAAQFNRPQGLAADNSGHLYVADIDNNTIRKIELSTGAVTTLAGRAGQPGSADGIGTTARFSYPNGLAIDSHGNLYVGDAGNHTVRQIKLATGEVTTLAGTVGMPGQADGIGAAARFDWPGGLAVDRSDNLYASDNGTVRKIALTSKTVTTLAGRAGQLGVKLGSLPGSLNYVGHPAVSPTGELFLPCESGILSIR